ncbi:hypothetical protein [Thermococcus sp.]
MGEIVITVPNGLERIIRRKVLILIKKESKKALKKHILKKYLGTLQGSIDEEEWYLQ